MIIPFNIRPLFERIAAKHEITVEIMLKAGRNPEQLAARGELAHLLRARGWSWRRIGHSLGGRDHTGIIYSMRVHGPKDFTTKRIREITCPDLSGEWAI